jgi:hypothetical protein
LANGGLFRCSDFQFNNDKPFRRILCQNIDPSSKVDGSFFSAVGYLQARLKLGDIRSEGVL